VFYDSPHDRMVLVANAGYETQQNEVWAFAHSGANPSTWSRLDAGGPSPSRWGASVVFDPPRNRILLFGGGTNTGGPQPYFNDVWSFPLTGGGGWTLVSTVGTRPLPRAYAIAAYDAGRDRIVLCGGRDDAGQFYEVWELSLAGSPTWNDITPAGGVSERDHVGNGPLRRDTRPPARSRIHRSTSRRGMGTAVHRAARVVSARVEFHAPDDQLSQPDPGPGA
jgi:hypothetical protein